MNTVRNRMAWIGAMVAAAILTAPAWAVDATWNGTSSAVWATEANWSATPVPGTGDTATFNNTGNANTTLDLGTGVTISNLLFDTASVAAYTIGAGVDNSQTLTLNNNGGITLSSSVPAAPQTIKAAIILGTDGATQTTTFTAASGKSLNLRNITGSSGTGTKTLLFSGAGNYSAQVIADGAGGGKVAVTTGSLSLGSANTFSGPLTVQGGYLSLVNSGSILNVSDIELGGILNTLATITLRNDTGNSARLNTGVNITGLGGSYLDLRGNASASSTVTIGTYESEWGVNIIRPYLASGAATDPMPVLTISNLVRPAGSIVNLCGGAVSTLSRVAQFNLGQGSDAGFAQVHATAINAGAPAAQLVNGIIPWAISAAGPASSGRFATYTANGFKPYGFDATGAVNDNGERFTFGISTTGGIDGNDVVLTVQPRGFMMSIE